MYVRRDRIKDYEKRGGGEKEKKGKKKGRKERKNGKEGRKQVIEEFLQSYRQE